MELCVVQVADRAVCCLRVPKLAEAEPLWLPGIWVLDQPASASRAMRQFAPARSIGALGQGLARNLTPRQEREGLLRTGS